mmetsp:Transcript_23414/g.56028  ORF Transcript_23414/g.56028 Transcript_23414/m.56028 type:complete len:291 (+) Transcript_23414:258-1130(+)
MNRCAAQTARMLGGRAGRYRPARAHEDAREGHTWPLHQKAAAKDGGLSSLVAHCSEAALKVTEAVVALQDRLLLPGLLLLLLGDELLAAGSGGQQVDVLSGDLGEDLLHFLIGLVLELLRVHPRVNGVLNHLVDDPGLHHLLCHLLHGLVQFRELDEVVDGGHDARALVQRPCHSGNAKLLGQVRLHGDHLRLVCVQPGLAPSRSHQLLGKYLGGSDVVVFRRIFAELDRLLFFPLQVSYLPIKLPHFTSNITLPLSHQLFRVWLLEHILQKNHLRQAYRPFSFHYRCWT